MKTLLALLLAGCSSCAPQPAPSPPPPAPCPVIVDSGPEPVVLDVYGQACAHLAALGCREGKDPHCAAVLAKVASISLTPTDATCIAHAPDVVHARECGAISCE